MTENSKNVFHFLHDNHDIRLTAGEIAEKLGITVSAVTGSVNGLVRKGYAARTEESVEVDGKKSVVKYIALTDEISELEGFIETNNVPNDDTQDYQVHAWWQLTR